MQAKMNYIHLLLYAHAHTQAANELYSFAAICTPQTANELYSWKFTKKKIAMEKHREGSNNGNIGIRR